MNEKKPSRERRRLKYPKDQMKPIEWLRFIQMPLFERCWKHLNLVDDDLRALEMLVMINPDGPPVISGTGGVRKIRFSGKHWSGGKRKGARVYYLYVPEKGLVFWLFMHTKNRQENISDAEKSAIRRLIDEILNSLENGA